MKIAVLLSGGVDSSVALKLLLQEGHEVEAFYLKVWLQDDLAFLGNCPWEEDVAYASEVCQKLNVPFNIVAMQEPYWREIVGYAIAEIGLGRTPNPDVLCNSAMKFGHFYSLHGHKYQAIASGHYAQMLLPGQVVSAVSAIGKDKNLYSALFADRQQKMLVAAKDSFKDQSYFLSRLSLKQLQRCCFPLGKFDKKEVRAMAAQFQLPTAKRKDSQGVCFLGKIKFSDFIAHHFGKQKGPVVHASTKKVLGEHDGHWFYTIGQRKGIGLGGDGPWYVCEKDLESNTIFVCHLQELSLAVDEFAVSQLSCSVPLEFWPKGEVEVKIRHGVKKTRLASIRKLAKAQQQSLALPALPLNPADRVAGANKLGSSRALPTPSLAESNLPDSNKAFFKVKLAEAETGVASGQFAVFYVKQLCIASAVIQRFTYHHAGLSLPDRYLDPHLAV